MKNGKILFTFLLLTALFIGVTSYVKSQTCSDANSCNTLIDQYTNQIKTLQGQSNTLKNQIAQFDAQIKLTSLKITQTEEQISLLSGRIDQLQGSLGSLSTAFEERAVETYKMARIGDPFILLVSADNLNEAFDRYSYLKKIQEGDRSLIQRLQTAQDNYEEEKTDQEDLQKKLELQKQQINTQKLAKNTLLSQTKNDESKYQSLLSLARAQLSALSNYSQSVGVSLVPHQDLSDGWGKYFNQRDESWGEILVNGDTSDCRKGPCTIARIGCLVTSYAMVVSHFGGSSLPSNVATNPSNFYASTADFNNPGPAANGHSASKIDNPSIDQLKNVLNSGGTVIAGLSKNGGPYPDHYSDHWVVLRSVDGDSFRINDPVYPGAMNVSFKDHYSGWSIIQARVYN